MGEAYLKAPLCWPDRKCVCNSLSTKTHSVYLGQQEEGPREEKSKSQHRPSLAPQLYIQLCAVLFFCTISNFFFLQSCTQLLWIVLVFASP